MAIIKNGRINIWNAVKKQFETVHPETETARITDFADGIIQKLALTSAMTAVTALQTDSWFGKLLKMALTASGVKYNIAQNGYVCFGSFFGGLIIQWGKCEKVGDSSWASTLNFNISFVNSTYYFGASIMNDNQKYNGDFDLQIVCTNVNNITLFKQEFVTNFSGNDRGYLWIAVGH